MKQLFSRPYKQRRKLAAVVNSALSIAIVGLFLVLIYFLVRYFFTLDQVVIMGTSTWPAGIDRLRGKNILFFTETDAAQRLSQSNLDAASVVVKKQFPATLIITFTKRQPIAQIVEGDLSYLVDAYGVVYKALSQPVSLPPVIALLTKVEVNSRFQAVWVEGVFTPLAKLVTWGIPIEHIKIVSDEEVIFATKNTQIIFSLTNNQSWLSSLQMLNKSFRIDDKIPRLIDFRFQKPVVRF